MKIDDAADVASATAKAVLQDMVREARGPVDFRTTMVCYRGTAPVAMLVLPPNRDTLLQTAFLAARGFGPDVIALTHDTYMSSGPPDEVKDPRTGQMWGIAPADGPGPMQTYVEEFGYDGTIVDALVTHVANRAGDAKVELQPYAVDGRWVRWLEIGQKERGALYRDDGVQHALLKMMGMTTLHQVMPNALPDWAAKKAASNPEIAQWSYDMATVTLIEEQVDTTVAVSLFAKPGTPRDQMFRTKFARSQVVDPSRWN